MVLAQSRTEYFDQMIVEYKVGNSMPMYRESHKANKKTAKIEYRTNNFFYEVTFVMEKVFSFWEFFSLFCLLFYQRNPDHR
jgi:hypothetical protein